LAKLRNKHRKIRSTEAEWTFRNLDKCHENRATLTWQHGQSRLGSVDIDKSQGLSACECSICLCKLN